MCSSKPSSDDNMVTLPPSCTCVLFLSPVSTKVPLTLASTGNKITVIYKYAH